MPEQPNWRFCAKCYGMFFAGYGGGTCPKGDKHSAQGNNFVLPYRTDGFIPPNNPPGRAGVDTKDPTRMFSAIIANAEYYGMPVKFLREVGQFAKLKVISDKDIQAFGGYW